MNRILAALTLSLAILAGGDFANAQAPHNQPGNNAPAQNNRPVLLQGREDLQGMGELAFVVRGNDVVMVDATKRPVRGVGSVNGNRVTMAFENCVYEGDYINGVYAGTARFTSGPNAGHTWNFNVRFAGNL